MTTGIFKCYICGKLRACSKKSVLKHIYGSKEMECVCLLCLEKIHKTNIIEVLNKCLRKNERLKRGI